MTQGHGRPSPGVAQDHGCPSGQRLTAPIFPARTSPEPPDPQDQDVETPTLGSPCCRCDQVSPQPGQVLLAWMRVRESMNKVGGNSRFPVGPTVGTPQGAGCWQDPHLATWHNPVTRAPTAAHSQHSCPGNTEALLGKRTQHRAVPWAHPQVLGDRGWDTGAAGTQGGRWWDTGCGTQGCRGMVRGGTGGQMVGTKAWGQRVRHRYRDKGNGTQGHGSVGTQGHLGTGEWDTHAGMQGCRDLCSSTTVSFIHHCSSPSQSQGNYELIPGFSVCPRNGISWMGASQQSEPSPGAAGEYL